VKSRRFTSGLPRTTRTPGGSRKRLAGERREIRLFEHGPAVLNALQDAAFDILITDLMLPGADGIQILNEVEATSPGEAIVIIMTGYASLDSAIRAIREEPTIISRKPFKLGELEVVIDNACDKICLFGRTNGCFSGWRNPGRGRPTQGDSGADVWPICWVSGKRNPRRSRFGTRADSPADQSGLSRSGGAPAPVVQKRPSIASNG